MPPIWIILSASRSHGAAQQLHQLSTVSCCGAVPRRRKLWAHEAGENIQTASSCSRAGRSGDCRRIRFSADEGLASGFRAQATSPEEEKEEGRMTKDSLQNQADRAEALAAQTADDELRGPSSRPPGNTESSSRAQTPSGPTGWAPYRGSPNSQAPASGRDQRPIRNKSNSVGIAALSGGHPLPPLKAAWSRRCCGDLHLKEISIERPGGQ